MLEEASEPGGAVRSGELVEPGFTHDKFSVFTPRKFEQVNRNLVGGALNGGTANAAAAALAASRSRLKIRPLSRLGRAAQR